MKIGIFGGAFDPLHREHLALLEAVKNEVNPDRIILIPTKEPPHKNALIASFEDRVKMLTAVFCEKYEVSRMEEELHGKNYSLNLAKEFAARYPNEEIMFILGGDSLRDLKIWHKPEELSGYVTFIAVPRKDKDDTEENANFARSNYGAKVIVTKYQGENISSSVLKGKLLLGLSVDGEVPDEALKYIREHGLYRKFSKELAHLRTMMSEQLYRHAERTTLFALQFCSRLQLQFEDVFLAAMLHDVAKEGDFPRIAGVPLSVAHQFNGAEIAQSVFSTTNPWILDAIRYHTTGRGTMSKLEKLIYAADKLEDGRNYSGVETLRASFHTDFDKGFQETVLHNYNYLRSVGAEIHPLQEECYQSYGKGE